MINRIVKTLVMIFATCILLSACADKESDEVIIVTPATEAPTATPDNKDYVIPGEVKTYFTKEENENFLKGIKLTKLQNFFYTAKYTEVNYEFAKKYQNKTLLKPSGCSCARNSNLVGRNYDAKYDNSNEFLIKVDSTQTRHASLGIATGVINNSLTNINTREYNKVYRLLPFYVVDGINDAGVVIAMNVITRGVKKRTTGTNKECEKLCLLSVPRYVLDYADSVDTAISILREKNLYAPISDNYAPELQFMIADKDKTVVVEFVNNKMVVLENENILTNFYLKDFDKSQRKLGEYTVGLERYNIIKKNLTSAYNLEGMLELMKSVRISRAYDLSVNPFWYTDYEGEYVYPDFSFVLNNYNRGADELKGSTDDAGEYKPALDSAIVKYKLHQRNGTFYHTIHSSVYDIENKKVTLMLQENDETLEFSLSE